MFGQFSARSRRRPFSNPSAPTLCRKHVAVKQTCGEGATMPFVVAFSLHQIPFYVLKHTLLPAFDLTFVSREIQLRHISSSERIGPVSTAQDSRRILDTQKKFVGIHRNRYRRKTLKQTRRVRGRKARFARANCGSTYAGRPRLPPAIAHPALCVRGFSGCRPARCGSSRMQPMMKTAITADAMGRLNATSPWPRGLCPEGPLTPPT